jgi:LysM repeat protein
VNKKSIYNCLVLFFCIYCCNISFAQTSINFSELEIDTTFRQINFYDIETAKNFKSKFEKSDTQKLVIFHFGGSHVQPEILTSETRDNFSKVFSTGGRGMIFPYSVAKTYSSINYSVMHTGEWKYGKSFQFPPKIPLGICGMAVETIENNASIQFNFKKKLEKNSYKLLFLIESDSLTPSFQVIIDSTIFEFDKKDISNNKQKHHFQINYLGAINHIKIKICDSTTLLKNFRFYGIDVELNQPNGIVYHSLGVGAAPFKSLLNISKIEEHADILKPDIVLLDFGTNDILYKNAIAEDLIEQIESTILRFRKINPDISIIFTSTQDLVYKKKTITAAITFRNIIDSLAKINKCMFWNWYDLSGGIGTIRKWHSLGYAQKDNIHLTMIGYKLKGQLLFESFIYTLNKIKQNPELTSFTNPLKQYVNIEIATQSVNSKITANNKGISKSEKLYKVKKGDTLLKIAKKQKVSVKRLKKLNGLKNDKISIGQILNIN